MKKWKKIFLGVSLSFMCIFTSIGYAALSDSLTIQGEAELEAPNAVFIVGISNVQTNGVTINQTPVNIGFPSTKFMTELVFSGKNSSISFDVLVKNGTNLPQFFNAINRYETLEGIEGTFSYTNVNRAISVSQGDEIGAGESKTYSITLTYTGSSTNQTRRMLYEIDYVFDSDDLTEEVSQGISDMFENILNNNLEKIEYEYNGEPITIETGASMEALVAQMKENSSATGNYIGNVVGSSQADKALLEALFGEELTYEINGVKVPITVMIKDENVYSGNTTNEMVLYFTADDLSESDWLGRATAPVYVVVYSVETAEDGDTSWKRIGDIYAGKANICDYSGAWYGSGSFNTDSWKNTEAYYGVSAGSSIDDIMDAYDATLQ